MFEDNILVFKALSDDSRLKIINNLMEADSYVELLAERLDLAASTVSFHLKKLEKAGLVHSRKDQYYTMYALDKSFFEKSLKDLIGTKKVVSAEEERQKLYREKVIKNFMVYGKLKSIPVQRKKRRIILEEILKDFEAGKTYTEKEVNDIIKTYHEDFCTLRREFIMEKLLKRDKGIYEKI
ncbi:metalloregulator ArsR/SmtB family transcription factor [Acidaminobacter sp. JC074]|uniref:DUF2087 domain-containing protein n=1 Tax=Acidaminobacter sp. JC074 TaxID=2530199 RepID=UPI001F0D177E|nr:metalloregulator ArsR/SmtB family transcription factor [Acidaminobacter sp. JC074]MCH4886127.1 metalloregulator ArsR/SmtB family transcription factor [Acidaminobacter sp. JC074]